MSATIEPLARPGRIAASIEVSPKQAIEFADLPGLFSPETRVYITDIGTDTNETLVAAAKRVTECGCRPVSHIAARRLTSLEALENRIQALSGDAGVQDVLVIGGGLARPAGPFSSSMSILETGVFDANGVTHIAVAGHPEGSPDFPEEVALEALRLKQQFGERTGAKIRIVTQFGFNPKPFIAWADALSSNGVDLPVHLGVAGPAKIATLIKFATMCGVGNSLDFFRKRAGSIARLATSHSPEDIVSPIERHVATSPQTPIHQIHVFPFGGLRKSAEWLEQRGTWAERTAAV